MYKIYFIHNKIGFGKTIGNRSVKQNREPRNRPPQTYSQLVLGGKKEAT